MMISSNFREWTLEKLEEVFGLQQLFQHPLIDRLFNYSYTLNEIEKFNLNLLRNNYLYNGGEDWNEVELENKFISPLIVLSQIDNRKFSYFLERNLKASIGKYELSGKVDGMIASGFRSPKKPYFCLHEYKKESDPEGDPKGQALVAMLAAESLNEDGMPVLGCYIQGKYWRFIVLDGLNYSFSETLVTDIEADICKVFKIIKALRYEIEEGFLAKPAALVPTIPAG